MVHGSPERSTWLAIACAAFLAACGGEAARNHYLDELVPGPPVTAGQAAQLARDVQARGELRLAEAFRLALFHNHSLKIRAESVVQADAVRREAIASLLPTLAVHGQLIQNPDEFRILNNVVPRRRIEAYGRATQTVFDARAFTAVQVASQARQIELLRLADERDRLLYEVAAAFYEVLGLDRDRMALAVRVERATERSRVVEVEVRAGKARPEDVFSARGERDQTEMSAIALDEQIARARLQLARLTGLPRVPERLSDSFEIRWRPGAAPELVEAAGKNRTELAIARRQVEHELAARRRVRAEYLPTATAEGIYWGRREDLEENIDWTVAIHADWVLFDGGGREARHARAASALRQARAELARGEGNLAHDVDEALLGFQSLERLATLLDGRAQAAAKALERTETALKAGSVTDLHFLMAKEAQAEAERDLWRARYARTLALLRIRLLIGDLRAALEESR